MNIDECCYGHEPAQSQLNVFRKTLSLKDKRIRQLEIALKRVEAQFAGYALRIAPNDEGNDIILGTIQDALKGV